MNDPGGDCVWIPVAFGAARPAGVRIAAEAVAEIFND